MLVERGSKRVVSFDISDTPKDARRCAEIEYVRGDLTNPDEVVNACNGVDCVFHIAALVGPYFPKDAYYKVLAPIQKERALPLRAHARQVNYEGTLNVLNACKRLGIKKIVMSSSPSTRFPYPDPNVEGLTEDQLKAKNGGDFARVFLQPYAETKALGEALIREACGSKQVLTCRRPTKRLQLTAFRQQGYCEYSIGAVQGDLLTIAVAPHQVYGPRDGLMLPSLLGAASTGRLRIFGSGQNLISFCHVDNYCHGLMLGAEALYPDSPALGKFYVITDDAPVKFWEVLDEAVIAMGFVSLSSKFKLPEWFMMTLAHIVVLLGNVYSLVSGTPKHVVNKYLKLNPFAVKMLVIHRYFDISAAKRDLKYKPLIQFADGWKQTIQWFKANWLPTMKKGR
jgi:nucleoside-diphosphate-sugar epimerase